MKLMLQIIKELVSLHDIKEMPNYNPSVPNGCDSVTSGKIYWDEKNLVTCVEHGACNAVNPDRTIWRCLSCHEGAWVVWDSEYKKDMAELN